MAQLRQGRARAWATETLTTIGEACRAVLRDTLGKTISWAIERATLDGWHPNRIKTHLALGSGSVWEHCTYNFEDLKSKLTHYLTLC